MSLFLTLIASPAVKTILRETISHPFNAELAKGTLALDKFQHYLKQDSLYLREFSKALALTATRLDSLDHFDTFIGFSQGAMAAERALHQHYFDAFNITANTALSPRASAYTNFLIATAYEKDPLVSIGALLPCFWVYQEVGKFVHATTSPHNPFKKWIDTYASEEFETIVGKAVRIFDEVCEKKDKNLRAEAQDAFVTSCRYEWMFWDAAYNKERWVFADKTDY